MYLDFRFYFHIIGGTQLAVAWVTTSESYTKVEISHVPAGVPGSTPKTLPALPLADGGGVVTLPSDPVLHYLRIIVKDDGSSEKKIPPFYVDFNNHRKF